MHTQGNHVYTHKIQRINIISISQSRGYNVRGLKTRYKATHEKDGKEQWGRR